MGHILLGFEINLRRNFYPSILSFFDQITLIGLCVCRYKFVSCQPPETRASYWVVCFGSPAWVCNGRPTPLFNSFLRACRYAIFRALKFLIAFCEFFAILNNNHNGTNDNICNILSPKRFRRHIMIVLYFL